MTKNSGTLKQNKTNMNCFTMKATRELEIPFFSLGDYQNMERTLKANPQLDTGDWYSKIIHLLNKRNV